MRIAIEAQRIFRPNKHGMDFVALESIKELQKKDHENEYFIFVSPGEDHCLAGIRQSAYHRASLPHLSTVGASGPARAVAKIKPDLLHCTSNTAPIHCPVPLVLTLHDIIFMEPRKSGNKSLYQNMGWHYRRLVVPRDTAPMPEDHNGIPFRAKPYTGGATITRRADHDRIQRIQPSFLPSGRSLSHYPEIYRGVPVFIFLGKLRIPRKTVPRTLKAYSLYPGKISQTPSFADSGYKGRDPRQHLARAGNRARPSPHRLPGLYPEYRLALSL